MATTKVRGAATATVQLATTDLIRTTTPSGRKKTKAHLAKLDEIKRVAAMQFYANGYTATDVRSISDAVHLHVSTLYTYIEGKEELLYLILEDGMREITAGLDAALDGKTDPVDRLHSAIKAHVLHHANRRQLAWTSRIEIRSLTGAYKDRIMALRDQYQARWVELVTEGQKAGVLADHDPKIAVFMMLGIGESIAGWFRPDGRMSAEELASSIATQVLNGQLATRPADPHKGP